MEEEIQPVISAFPGFMKRQLGKFQDGDWMVQIQWRTDEARAAWTDFAKQHSVPQKQHQMLDMRTMEMRAFEVLMDY